MDNLKALPGGRRFLVTLACAFNILIILLVAGFLLNIIKEENE